MHIYVNHLLYWFLITKPVFSASSLYLRVMTTLRMAASKAKMNVQSFPRPPLLEKVPRHIQVKWDGQVIADTSEAYWVLETHHAPCQ